MNIKLADETIHKLETKHTRVLIMTAVEAEQAAVLRGLRGSDRFDVLLAGVGPASAAAHTSAALSQSEYSLVISAGIAGGFSEVAPIGSVVIAERIIAADLGAETPDGFSSVDELGFGSSNIETDNKLALMLTSAMAATELTVCCRPILSVSTATGSAERATILQARVSGAGAEAMEGYGVAEAARIHGLPVLEIRTISNAVGPRDRSAWRIGDALASLELASTILLEVLES
ncbi:futalosine hydrolase [Paenibacillus pini]|uniref:Futalosine hydrolase n=1 Tax=Paenibacillus pini JCM 16418 TaxID=1236976 RepID=W7YH19_9BACL|nr:futalosine hydrolase [Paenibacillus pini]GAF07757.1 menaquinone via futalosine step 2 [Paenibacillus pini JCM 16418]